MTDYDNFKVDEKVMIRNRCIEFHILSKTPDGNGTRTIKMASKQVHA